MRTIILRGSCIMVNTNKPTGGPNAINVQPKNSIIVILEKKLEKRYIYIYIINFIIILFLNFNFTKYNNVIISFQKNAVFSLDSYFTLQATVWFMFMVFNAIFNNISAILWLSVLLYWWRKPEGSRSMRPQYPSGPSRSGPK